LDRQKVDNRLSSSQRGSLAPHTRTPSSGIHSSQNRQLVLGQAADGQQALIITERILGTTHKDTIFRYSHSSNKLMVLGQAADETSSSHHHREDPWHLTQGHHLQVFTALRVDTWSLDRQQMKKQALIITERILGTSHKDTIFRYSQSLEQQLVLG
jgi:hypothetical protein